MAVVPIKGTVEQKPPEVDPDLVSVLENLLLHAKAGEVRGLCVGFVVCDESDFWFMADEGYIPITSFITRKAVQDLESDE